jgi:hypothetical protein
MEFYKLRYFAFIAFLFYGVSVQAEKSEAPFFSIEADVVGFCLTAQKDMSLLYNANGAIVRGFRTFSPYYNVAAYAEIEISPDNYNSFNLSYLGPLKILHRNLFNRTANVNLGQIFTAPYTTSDWGDLFRYEYKESMELNLFTAEYWYHLTPRFIDYFSCSLSAQARLLFLSDYYDVKSSDGVLKNLLNINIDDDMFGGWFGFHMNGRPLTRWAWNLEFGGGAYGNWVQKGIYLQDRGGTKVHQNSDLHSTDLSGSIDGEFGMEYSINSFAFKLVFWGSQYYGMPTAGGQLGKNNLLNKVYSDSTLSFIGFKGGFVARW